MGFIETLRRRERAVAAVRWVAAVAVLAQSLLVRGAGDARPGPVPGLVVGGCLVVIGVVVVVLLRHVRTADSLRRAGVAILAADAVVALGFALSHTQLPQSPAWGALAVVLLEAALRLGYQAALACWVVLAAAYLTGGMAREADAAPLLEQSAYLFLIALFSGLTASELGTERYLFQKVAQGSSELTAEREVPRILETLCRRLADTVDAARVAVVDVDAPTPRPLAASPGDAGPVPTPSARGGGAAGAGQRADAAGRTFTLPLRWQGGPRAVVVVELAHARPNALLEGAARALVEAAAVALATTSVIEAEQRSKARLMRLEALRARFVATVAHDLRSPLTTVKGVASALRLRRSTVPQERVDAMLASVERQANRLNRLADDLLDAARVDSGEITLNTGPCDLESVIASTVPDLEADVEVFTEGNLVLEADGARLERVLWNLLTNAHKYGQPPIEVHARRCEEVIELRVRDHGAGVAPELHERMFDEFAHGGAVESVGLGLAIVRRLVEAHGGTVDYVPVDPGATFVVTLPVAGP